MKQNRKKKYALNNTWRCMFIRKKQWTRLLKMTSVQWRHIIYEQFHRTTHNIYTHTPHVWRQPNDFPTAIIYKFSLKHLSDPYSILPNYYWWELFWSGFIIFRHAMNNKFVLFTITSFWYYSFDDIVYCLYLLNDKRIFDFEEYNFDPKKTPLLK